MSIVKAYTDKDCEDYFTIEIDIPMNIHQAYTDKYCEDYFYTSNTYSSGPKICKAVCRRPKRCIETP